MEGDKRVNPDDVPETTAPIKTKSPKPLEFKEDRSDIERRMRFTPQWYFKNNEPFLHSMVAHYPGLSVEELFRVASTKKYFCDDPPTWTREKVQKALDCLEEKGYIKSRVDPRDQKKRYYSPYYEYKSDEEDAKVRKRNCKRYGELQGTEIGEMFAQSRLEKIHEKRSK
jgi:hypothetical protein